jgi:catechol 2,3-dioxygenase-like lactoylglutathione lyase family enzyme
MKPQLPTLHHVTLTVTDPEASATFYQDLLGPAEAAHRQGPDWVRLRLLWPNGLMIGFTRHDGTAETDRFDHRRVGLDHAGLQCADEADIDHWVRVMDDLGIPHGPVEHPAYAVVVTGRDPDGIPIEFYWPRQGGTAGSRP